MKVDYAVMNENCKPLLAVSERLARGQLVLFSNGCSKIIKDEQKVKLIEGIAEYSNGFKINRIGNGFYLDGELKERADMENMFPQDFRPDPGSWRSPPSNTVSYTHLTLPTKRIV